MFLFEDEVSLSNTATLSYAWSCKGKQPVVKQKQSKRERLTLFGAVNPISGEVIAKRSERGNAKTFKRFLIKILHFYKNTKGKIHLILDNVRFHHAKILRPFLKKHKEKLEFIFLPPYSPDLNPIERVWWYMRKKITHNRYINTMESRVGAFWRMFSHYQKPNQEIVTVCNLNYSV